uniref:Uncharacterized protein n=1 Tax=Amphimedon queenslandica TaxID=400682 RepID=A0A1X7TLG4_AMPQE
MTATRYTSILDSSLVPFLQSTFPMNTASSKITTPSVVAGGLSATAENDKKRKYVAACESNHCSFTPLCLTVDGVMGSEMRSFIDCLADCLSVRWDLHYSVTVNWVRTKLSFALLRATNLCICGTRSKWRGMTIEDGLGVNPSLFSY